MRRFARITGTLMIVAGIGALAWALTVWKWEDPFTAAVNYFDQRELAESFDRRLEEGRPAVTAAVDMRTTLPRSAVAWRRSSKRGDAVARLRIPRLGLTEVIVNGTDTDSLKRGPGRYLGSAMPGEGELVYVAGHRTTYGAPFSRIDRLRKGDRVFVELPYGTFEYAITGHRIPPPAAASSPSRAGTSTRASAAAARAIMCDSWPVSGSTTASPASKRVRARTSSSRA